MTGGTYLMERKRKPRGFLTQLRNEVEPVNPSPLTPEPSQPCGFCLFIYLFFVGGWGGG